MSLAPAALVSRSVLPVCQPLFVHYTPMHQDDQGGPGWCLRRLLRGGVRCGEAAGFVAHALHLPPLPVRPRDPGHARPRDHGGGAGSAGGPPACLSSPPAPASPTTPSASPTPSTASATPPSWDASPQSVNSPSPPPPSPPTAPASASKPNSKAADSSQKKAST